MRTCPCGHPLWAVKSQATGYCEYCRLHHCVHWPVDHQPRTLPYTFSPGYVPPDKRETD